MAEDGVVARPIPRLDDSAKRYYNKVESSSIHDRDDVILFSKNVMKQVISDGVARVCCDKDGSRALEQLFVQGPIEPDTLGIFLDAILAGYTEVATNRCGSHVIEVLLKSLAKSISRDYDSLAKGISRDDGSPESLTRDIISQFQLLCTHLKEHVPEFIGHSYASHVISSLVQALSGVYVGDHVSRSRYSQEFRKAKMPDGTGDKTNVTVLSVPASFIKQLESVSRKISKMDNFPFLLTHHCSCPVIQTLLRVLTAASPTRASKLIKKIIKKSNVFASKEKQPSDSLPRVFTDLVGSHLIETVIEVATPDLFNLVYESCFKGQLMTFALHPVANYPLQKLLAGAAPEQVSSFIEEITSLEEILFAGHTGVVVKLVDAAVSCPEKQPALLQLLLTAFHAQSKPKKCAHLFLSLMAYEVYFKSDSEDDKSEASPSKSISLHGSLMLQSLLKFQDTKLVARSLLKMTPDVIIKVSCDSCGSHSITTFITSSTVSLKNKIKLMDVLETHLVQLSKDKHGSRVVDTLWRQCEIGHKDQLAERLLTHEEELTGDFYGHIVLRNCNIVHYKKKQDMWRDGERVAEKKRNLFEDILGDGKPASKRRKQENDVHIHY